MTVKNIPGMYIRIFKLGFILPPPPCLGLKRRKGGVSIFFLSCTLGYLCYYLSPPHMFPLVAKRPDRVCVTSVRLPSSFERSEWGVFNHGRRPLPDTKVQPWQGEGKAATAVHQI